jgi:hypothetical protein
MDWEAVNMHRTGTALGRTLVATFALVLAPVAWAQTNDSIQSRHVKEADNLGQDTNSGSGIKTGHLSNGAVTAPKIAEGAVGTAAIAAGAVTSDKLAGQIPAAKLDSVGLDADLLDGQHASAFALAGHGHADYRKNSPRVLVVAKDGSGDFTDPVSAMDAITDASATNPYLIKVLPGDYQIAWGWRPKSNVDVEGSGQGPTTIWARCPDRTSGPVLLAAVGLQGAEFRNLTLEMRTGGPLSAYSVLLVDQASFRMSGVRLLCASGDGGTCTHAAEVRFGGQLVLEESVVQTDGAGIFLKSLPGYVDSPAVLWMRGGEIDAPVGSVAVTSETNALTRFYGAGVQSYGPLLYPTSLRPETFKCAWCFDGNFDPIAAP